jgi:SAM-dependent methyltransferase
VQHQIIIITASRPIDEETNLIRVFLCSLALLASAAVSAQTGSGEAYNPVSGQPGKDVVWVPTPYALIEKMLDMAKVTAQDYVMDLGSGDGRNVIMAAKRGARALGVEYNPEMVALSRRNAAKEGVAERAKFVQGDMFEADVSQATVLALFLLPDNLRRLTPKFQSQLKPGTRLVMNGFPIPDWSPDLTETATGECGNWCTSHLYYAPAKVGGSWRLGQNTLRFEQSFQMLSGTLNKVPITNGRLKGEEISFTVGDAQYVGRVNGNAMSGELKGPRPGQWKATRLGHDH